MILAAAMGTFGMFLLTLSALLLNGQRKNRMQLHRLDRQVERAVDNLRTPGERALREMRKREIEAAKQATFEFYDDGT